MGGAAINPLVPGCFNEGERMFTFLSPVNLP